MHALYLLFSALFFSSPAFADPVSSCAEEFRSAAKLIPVQLVGMGKTKFGRLDLAKLITEIDAITILYSGGKDIVGKNLGTWNGSQRSTARWETKNGKRFITVDCKWFRKFPGLQATFALHEVLGVTGHYDWDYWLSVSLWLLTQPNTLEYLLPKQIEGLEGFIVASANIEGGVIGVGGGGEIASLYARMVRLLMDLEDLYRFQTAPPSKQEKIWEKILEHLISDSDYSVPDEYRYKE